MAQHKLSPTIQAVIDDLLPNLRALGEGRCAVSLGGSYGKGNHDSLSDLDFRLFCDSVSPESEEQQLRVKELAAAIQHWGERGITIDGYWMRIVKDVSEQLDQWCAGIIASDHKVWTIWGYHLPTDINNQYVIDDPHGIIAGWQAQLTPYPPALKNALLVKHTASIRYWRNDYHLRNKVQRKDSVFLVGLTSKIVHDLIQILFALNETYYVGDGNNLAYVQQFAHVPANFVADVEAVLMAGSGDNRLEQQNQRLFHLIDAVEALLKHLDILI